MPSDDVSRGRSAPRPLVACFLFGVGAAALGLVPWLITGMRLPLQNLWAVQTASDEMPIVLLPFNQYFLTVLAALLVIGGVVAGVAGRAMGRRLPERGWAVILLGVVLIQGLAVLQTSLVVRAGLQERRESDLYFAALVALAVFAVAVGVLALVLVARAPRAGALVGLGIGAVMTGPWLNRLIVVVGEASVNDVTSALGVARWVPAVLIGAAIVWAGIATVGRVLAAVGNLLGLWLVPALMTGVAGAAGSRVLARHPEEMIAYGREVFMAAATSPGLVVGPLLVAVVVAVLGLWVGRLLPTLVLDPGESEAP